MGVKSGWIKFSTLILFMLVFGCERGQQMIAPVMSEQPVVEQPTTDTVVESPVTDIFTDIDLPPEPTIPEGTVISDTDFVFHATSEEVQQWREEFWDSVMVDTANEAYQSEAVTNFFNDAKERAEKECGSNVHSSPPEVSVYFRSREERERFKELLPGTWATDIVEVDRDGHWWRVTDSVGIIDKTDVYYLANLSANWDPCVFRDQPE